MRLHEIQGYIFIVTLFMIASMTAISTYLYIRGSSYVPFMHTMIDQQKAKSLAQAGLQIGIAQLVYVEPTKKEGQSPQGQQTAAASDNPARQLYVRLMPIINRWQSYALRQEVDGINGLIRICIMCEEGKLDLNQIYDFKRKQFKGQGAVRGDMKKIMEVVCKRFESAMGITELLPALENYLKKRGYPLNDVTELLSIAEFAPFAQRLFYTPRQETKPSEKPVLYLTDIFTVHSGKMTIEPRLFSDSWLGILHIRQAYQGEVAERSELIKKIGKQFKQTVQWSSDWNTELKPIYQKELQSLPKGLDSVLSTTFDPQNFVIRIDATVGSVTQQLLAIVTRQQSTQAGKVVFEGIVKKMYWL